MSYRRSRRHISFDISLALFTASADFRQGQWPCRWGGPRVGICCPRLDLREWQLRECSGADAPGPSAGAGLPALAIGLGVYCLAIRRRKVNEQIKSGAIRLHSARLITGRLKEIHSPRGGN